VVLALVAGWLGGELVNRLGVGIDDGANLDAQSSLRGPATSARGTKVEWRTDDPSVKT
jgi:hypothetical protein